MPDQSSYALQRVAALPSLRAAAQRSRRCQPRTRSEQAHQNPQRLATLGPIPRELRRRPRRRDTCGIPRCVLGAVLVWSCTQR